MSPDWRVDAVSVSIDDVEDSQIFTELFENKIGAIRIENFIDPEICERMTEQAYRFGFEYYETVIPPIGRIGITQFEHAQTESQKRIYFRQAAQANADRVDLFGMEYDPVYLVKSVLERFYHVMVAREDDAIDYFCGLVRMINEALVHCDWAPLDASQWAIGDIDAQLAWNVYLQTPRRGGVTEIYNLPWTEMCELQKVSGSYGYKESLVGDAQSVRMKPVAGDLILFNSRNFHRVHPSAGDNPVDRISVSSFIGRKSDHSLVMWS